MKKTLVRSLAMAFVGSLLVAGSAMALPTLTLTSGATVVSVGDGSALDSNPLAGVVTYIGTVGANWNINVSTGVTLATGGTPNMDLNSIDGSLGSGSLTISYLDSIVGPWTGDGFRAAVGGTIAPGALNNASFSAKVNGVVLNTMSFVGGGGFSDNQTVDYTPLVGANSFEMIAVLNHVNGGGLTSFDYKIDPVPEPATMLLLGTGLVGLAGARRRKKAAKA